MSFLDKILSAKGGSASDRRKKEAGKNKERPETEKDEKSKAKEVRYATPEKILVGVLKGGHVTEKTSSQAKQNKYVFVVGKMASKLEIRKAVERRFSVSVESVNVMLLPGKERRRGNRTGFKPGFKKAVVTIKEGQTIEMQ